MASTAQLEDFDEQLYKVIGEKGEERYLIATSEQVWHILSNKLTSNTTFFFLKGEIPPFFLFKQFNIFAFTKTF